MVRFVATSLGFVFALIVFSAARPASAVTVTSNDFVGFVNAILATPMGGTIDFDLGADSTIHFTEEIHLPRDVTFVGDNADNPALDAGANPAGLLNDQRGLSFARTSGTGTDIGAFERQIPEPSTAILATMGLVGLLAFGWRRRKR